MRIVRFTLPEPTPLLNVQQRKHYRVRSREKRRLALQIFTLIGKNMPHKPFQKARVHVTRYSSGTPDDDGLYGGLKDLLDCLTTPKLMANGKFKNKYGISLIVDDAPAFCETIAKSVKCKRYEQRTEIVVEDVS
jgi:hypothetical protein